MVITCSSSWSTKQCLVKLRNTRGGLDLPQLVAHTERPITDHLEDATAAKYLHFTVLCVSQVSPNC